MFILDRQHSLLNNFGRNGCPFHRVRLISGEFCAKLPHQTGISLVELIIFIVIVGIAVTGILSAINTTTAHSGDPVSRKQALSIAESLMEEVSSQAFTWCDPSDPAVNSATSRSECTLSESLGPEAGQSRYGPNFFNNVNDYANFSMAGIAGIDGSTIPELQGYAVTVSISEVGSSFGLVDSSAALQIDIVVTGGGEQVTLRSFRFRHSPNSGG